MALNITNMERVFTLPDGTELQDPNPNLSPEEVIKHYSALYPQITNGTIKEITQKDVDGVSKAIYVISQNPGRLG